MIDRCVEITSADTLGDGFRFEIGHEGEETGLCFLGGHGCGFDSADFGEGVFLGGGWERVDMVEDVGRFRD